MGTNGEVSFLLIANSTGKVRRKKKHLLTGKAWKIGRNIFFTV